MRNRTKTTLAATVITSSILLSGCGLFGGDEKTMEEMDPPQDVSFTDDAEAIDGEVTEEVTETEGETDQEAVTETVGRELFLIDSNGMVVPQTVELPKTDSAARQVLEYLVNNGPVAQMLPNGFRAVIPQDTQVDVNLEGSKIIADFSKEFTEYQPEDEEKILQAITWTLTQFDNIEEVEIRVNGHKLEEMPVNGTPISESLSRADGINFDSSVVVDITNTKPVTLYFIAETDKGDEYYVPVTRRISNTETDPVKAVVNELIDGPTLASKLLSEFHNDVELLESSYADGVVTLNFNEAILGSFEDNKMISSNVFNSLILSLTEQTGVESVAIQVDGKEDIVSEDGKSLSEPVSRPENVNTGSF